MLIGKQYSDDRLYRGILHFDGLPLTSEDIHEYSDTSSKKTAYILNNILGYGILNTPPVIYDSTGIRLSEPAVLLLDGDVSLIHSDADNPLIPMEAISSSEYIKGTVCIVGWYQQIDSTTTMRHYGGVNNSKIQNDLIRELSNGATVQISTRYQFRWLPVLLNSADVENEIISFTITDRDSNGSVLSTHSSITTTNKVGRVFIAPTPSRMSGYAESDLFVIPLLTYEYSTDNDEILSAKSLLPLTPKGSSGFINSESMPLGEYIEGTTWYNPITREFKQYIPGVGFVDSASKMGFMQYQTSHTITKDVSTPQDIPDIPININGLSSSDTFHVIYEGLLLVKNENYTINYQNNSITLLNFTTKTGEKITFEATKIVEANDMTNITTSFTNHLTSTSSKTIAGHTKLSDEINQTMDTGKGVAATPKSVYESKLIKDNTTGIKYKFGVGNGLLYIEEV